MLADYPNLSRLAPAAAPAESLDEAPAEGMEMEMEMESASLEQGASSGEAH